MPGPSRNLGIDAYQLTTLVAHADEARLDHTVSMAFFFRRMPHDRGYVVACGLRQILDQAAGLGFDERERTMLLAHPVIGPALAARPALTKRLFDLSGFQGSIDALPEGTLAFAGPGLRTDGTPLQVAGAPLHLYTPLLQIRTDIVRAKLVETPWLGYLNHLSMVASKAARVVSAAAGKPVIEFGARRTHPAAAVDATYAAYLGGTRASSNLAAALAYGVPATGTMDHFAVQASERGDLAPEETEQGFFAAFFKAFPDASILLVDTYDTERGIARAVAATDKRLVGVRLDSNVTPDTVRRARALLDGMGAPQAKIFCSDGLCEDRVAALADLADGFGVGENITCSPDSATGIGAVAKLVVNGYGKVTMKLARGSGKATLPGELAIYRSADHDLVALASEAAPSGGRSLLEPVWRGTGPVSALPPLAESRALVERGLAMLPPDVRTGKAPYARRLVASDALVGTIERIQKGAHL
jgi:nicotinate phosphoribosyltransferase